MAGMVGGLAAPPQLQSMKALGDLGVLLHVLGNADDLKEAMNALTKQTLAAQKQIDAHFDKVVGELKKEYEAAGRDVEAAKVEAQKIRDGAQRSSENKARTMNAREEKMNAHAAELGEALKDLNAQAAEIAAKVAVVKDREDVATKHEAGLRGREAKLADDLVAFNGRAQVLATALAAAA